MFHFMLFGRKLCEIIVLFLYSNFVKVNNRSLGKQILEQEQKSEFRLKTHNYIDLMLADIAKRN